MSPISRRQRKIILWLILLISIFLIASALIWFTGNNSSSVSAGSDGLTSKLDRNLPDDLPSIQFEDITHNAGIRFKHFHGTRGSRITEDMGSGVAWVDYNNDGFEDLFIVNIAGPMDMPREDFRNSPATSKLYRNNGDGSFTDVTTESGLELRMHGMGTAWADIDNNGTIDCLVTGYNQLRLFSNNGDGTFREITKEAGLKGFEDFWAGAAWGDANNDGYVDLYVTGYLSYFEIPDVNEIKELHEPPSINPSVFDPIGNLFLINNGDGTFREASRKLNIKNENGKGLEAAWIDFTGDNFPELYITNDVSDNALYKNSGKTTFLDISYQAKVADYRGSMGLAVGDWNGDEDLDLFITHWIAQENALYSNMWSDDGNGMLFFKDEADQYGLGQSSLDYVGWGTFFFDIDNDSRPDLFVANGHTNQRTDQPEKMIGMRDLLYWNRNNKDGFYEIGEVSGDYFSEEFVGRGTAYGDYNNDGRVDLFIVNHDGPGVLLENQTKTTNNWLKVELEGTKSNRSAYGTKLRLITPDGVQIKQVGMQASYLSHNSLTQHFGLHEYDSADSLIIKWPSGQVDEFANIQANQKIKIVEGEGTYQ